MIWLGFLNSFNRLQLYSGLKVDNCSAGKETFIFVELNWS